MTRRASRTAPSLRRTPRGPAPENRTLRNNARSSDFRSEPKSKVRIDFVFRREIHERVILDVEIRRAEIQFFARVDEFRLGRRPQFLAPKIRSRNINFVARPPRQTRALQLGDVGRSKSSPRRDRCRSQRKREIGQSASRCISVSTPCVRAAPRLSVSNSPLNPITFDRSL